MSKASQSFQEIWVDRLKKDPKLVVEYVQKQPGRGTLAAQILTEPYHRVSVPQHAGPVRFLHVPGK